MLPLDAAGDGLWSRFVPGLGAGQAYGLRAHGPWNPETGHRFNPARLLMDPWAPGFVGDTARLALQTQALKMVKDEIIMMPLHQQPIAWALSDKVESVVQLADNKVRHWFTQMK